MHHPSSIFLKQNLFKGVFIRSSNEANHTSLLLVQRLNWYLWIV